MNFQMYTWVEYCSEVSGISANVQVGKACIRSAGMHDFLSWLSSDMLLQACFKYPELNSLCGPALVQEVAADAALQPRPGRVAAIAAKQPLHKCMQTLTGRRATMKILR